MGFGINAGEGFWVRIFGYVFFFTVNALRQYVFSDLYVVVQSVSLGAHPAALASVPSHKGR